MAVLKKIFKFIIIAVVAFLALRELNNYYRTVSVELASIYTMLTAYAAAGVYVICIHQQERTNLYIEDNTIYYKVSCGTTLRKYLFGFKTKIFKSIPLSNVTNVLVICKTEKPDVIADKLYSIYIYSGKEYVGACVDIGGYQSLFNIFKDIYSHLALKLKIKLIDFILNGDTAEKKKLKFPLAVRNNGLKVKYAKNPYDAESKEYFVFYSWKDLEAKLDDDNLGCTFTTRLDPDFRYKFRLPDRIDVYTCFDFYVLYELVQDMHRQGVSMITDLDY